MGYIIVLDPKAVQDIQESIDYYEEQQPGLGRIFEEQIDHHFTVLKKNPFFQIRYDSVHCLPLKQFPHMIHYTISQKKNEIFIHAVFHTAMDPKKWKKK